MKWCLLFLMVLASALTPSLSANKVDGTVQINVPTLNEEIPLTQAFENEPWRRAARVFGFSLLTNAQKPATYETEVRFLSDRENLYVGMLCHLPTGIVPRQLSPAAVSEPNAWKEDSVELFLAADGSSGGDIYQFILGASGAYFQRKERVTGVWETEWRGESLVRDGRWFAIYKIPFKSIGLKSAPSTLRFAVARNTYEPIRESTYLIPTTNHAFVDSVEKMGRLRFDPEAPVAALSAKRNFSLGEILLFADAVQLPPDKFADSILEVVDSKGNVIAEDRQQSRFDSRTVIHRINRISDGEYKLRYKMRRAESARVAVYGADAGLQKLDKKTLENSTMQVEWPISVQAKLAVSTVVTLPERASRLRAEVSTRGYSADPNLMFSFTLQDLSGKTISELGTHPYSSNTVFEAPLPELAERTDYHLVTRVISEGKQLAQDATLVKTPPKPLWIGTTVGMSNDIPKPWTPVVLDGRKVSVWGREYVFDSGPVPSSVLAHGRQMLAEPSKLVLQPAPNSWKLVNSRLEGDPARAALFEWESEGSSVVYKATTRVEFDGAIRIDVTIPAGADVKKMAFEMPADKEKIHYVHRGPLMWGGMSNSYSLPNHPESYKIISVFHFLDDKGGITWFDLMPFNWQLSSPNKALEMIPGEKEALLRVNYIDSKRVYPIDRTFSFGLQALPARPMPEKQEILRWWTGVSYGDEDPQKRPAWFSDIEYEGEGNVKVQEGTAELWIKPASDAKDRFERYFSIEHGKMFQFQLVKKNPEEGLTVRINGGGTPTDYPTRYDLPLGKWSHVAVTWDAKELRVVVNGDVIATFPIQLASRFTVPVHRIYVGGDQVHVDSLRISDIARTKFDLSAPPQPDSHTLLCDTMDRVEWINGRKGTQPERGSAKMEAGYLSPDAQLAEGKWGQGLAPLKTPVKSTIQGMAECGLTMIMYHALQYTDISCGGLYIANEPAFEKLNKATKEAGLKVCMYINNSLSNYDWMWQTYAKDWLIEPRDAPFIQATIPNEHVYQVSPRSEYFEFFIWRLSELQKQYGVDGFFLDGRMYCTSRNPGHEPILKNFEGEEVARRDMWDGRNRQMRVMNTIHEQGGFYLQHKSGLWDAPAVFFNDGVWEGEQLMGTTRGDKKPLDMLPLDAFRAQISGINFGMPSCYAAPPYSPLDPIEMATYSFVHGTTPTPFYRIDEALVYQPFWKAMDAFGATYQNFRGYWNEEPPAKAVPKPETTKVSAYVKEGKTLLIVSNFDTQPVEGSIELNLKTLGLQAPEIKDALTGERVETQDGKLPITVKGMRSGWFLLEEKK